MVRLTTASGFWYAALTLSVDREPFRIRVTMTPVEKKGRVVVLVIVWGTLFLSACVIGAYVAVKGTDRLPAQAVRFVLTAGLMWWLYRGSPTAKWITVVLFGLAGLAGLASLFLNHRMAILVGTKLGALYLSFVVTLVTSSPANAFLEYQRSGQHNVNAD